MSAISSCSSNPNSLLLQINQSTSIAQAASTPGTGAADDQPDVSASPDASKSAPVKGTTGPVNGIDDSMLAKIRAAINDALRSSSAGVSGVSWLEQVRNAITQAVQSANPATAATFPHQVPNPLPPVATADAASPTPSIPSVAPPVAKIDTSASGPALATPATVPIVLNPSPTAVSTTSSASTTSVGSSSVTTTDSPAVSADTAQNASDQTSPGKIIASWLARSGGTSPNDLLLNQPLFGDNSNITIASLLRGLFVDASA